MWFFFWQSSAPVPLNQSPIIVPIYFVWTKEWKRLFTRLYSLKYPFLLRFKMDAVLTSAAISDDLTFVKHTLGSMRPSIFHFYVWSWSSIVIFAWFPHQPFKFWLEQPVKLSHICQVIEKWRRSWRSSSNFNHVWEGGTTLTWIHSYGSFF